MVEYLQLISDVLKTYPSYIGEGVIELLIMVAGSLIVGFITSKYLYKINELNKIEGWLLEKRIPIYEEIFKRTEEMMEIYIINPKEYAIIEQIFKANNLKLDRASRQVSSVFMDPDKFSEIFRSFDQHVAQNRLFFDTEVSQELIVLQNYYALLRRILVMFDEQMIALNIDKDKLVKSVRSQLLIAIGINLSEEFLQYVTNVQNTIRISMHHLRFSHRKKPDYSYDFYQSENGFVMSRLKESKAIKDSESLNDIIAVFAEKALQMQVI